MIPRSLWLEQIAAAWRRTPIVWLCGVRRVGKTTLARELSDSLFVNCDLASSAERLADPEAFFASVRQPIVVLDEIHQLPDPSRILKIAADEFPRLKVLATGSSTLAATRKFRDSLTGRKHVIGLRPVLVEELKAFGDSSLRERLLRGGLPEPLLGLRFDQEFFQEWLDSYFARDVQELFHVGRRAQFLSLVELLLRQSGGLMEVSALSKLTGLSRPTVTTYLDALEITQVIDLLRPFSGGGRRELVAQPKVYGFDTGFIAHTRGWRELREEDCGLLWEHLVLDTLRSIPEVGKLHYWRDKPGHEVDFVVPAGRAQCVALECKWKASAHNPRNLAVFRAAYPSGRNFVVSPQTGPPFSRRHGDLDLCYCHARDLRALLTESSSPRRKARRARTSTTRKPK